MQSVNYRGATAYHRHRLGAFTCGRLGRHSTYPPRGLIHHLAPININCSWIGCLNQNPASNLRIFLLGANGHHGGLSTTTFSLLAVFLSRPEPTATATRGLEGFTFGSAQYEALETLSPASALYLRMWQGFETHRPRPAVRPRPRLDRPSFSFCNILELPSQVVNNLFQVKTQRQIQGRIKASIQACTRLRDRSCDHAGLAVHSCECS